MILILGLHSNENYYYFPANLHTSANKNVTVYSAATCRGAMFTRCDGLKDNYYCSECDPHERALNFRLRFRQILMCFYHKCS